MAIILGFRRILKVLHLQLRPLRNTRLQGDICLGPPWIIRRTTFSRIGLKFGLALLKERVNTFLVVPANSEP